MTPRLHETAETEQTWVLGPLTGPMLSTNDQMHWRPKAEITRRWRTDARVLAQAANVPHLERVRIVVEWLPPDRRRRDPANLALIAKAITDGLVDAAVVADDDHLHVSGPYCELGELTRPRIPARRICQVRILITREVSP